MTDTARWESEGMETGAGSSGGGGGRQGQQELVVISLNTPRLLTTVLKTWTHRIWRVTHVYSYGLGLGGSLQDYTPHTLTIPG